MEERAPSPDILIQLTPTGVVTGRVTRRGQLARGVWVRALRAGYLDGRRTLAVGEYAVTDDRGEYRLFGLSPGSYVISAIPVARPRVDGDALVVPAIPSNENGNRTEVRSPITTDNVSAAAFDTRVYPAVYYPGTFDPAAATPIEIGPGAVVMSIDLALASTATFHVRGRISTQGLSNPAPRVRVSVQPAESGTATPIPVIDVTAGDFDLPGVPPGRYYLGATVINLPGDRSPSVFARVPIEVWDRDLEGVTPLLQPGVTVMGRVQVDGAIPGPDQRVMVQLNGLYGLPGTGAQRIEHHDRGC